MVKVNKTFVEIGGTKVGFVEAGQGAPVIFVQGPFGAAVNRALGAGDDTGLRAFSFRGPARCRNRAAGGFFGRSKRVRK